MVYTCIFVPKKAYSSQQYFMDEGSRYNERNKRFTEDLTMKKKAIMFLWIVDDACTANTCRRNGSVWKSL